jgi:predicted small metal-binding protein
LPQPGEARLPDEGARPLPAALLEPHRLGPLAGEEHHLAHARAPTFVAMVAGEPPSTGRHGAARIGEDTMKELSCSAMGVECAFRAEGETADEVKAKLLEHAAAEHADMLAGMTEAQKAEMMMTMDEKIAAH